MKKIAFIALSLFIASQANAQLNLGSILGKVAEAVSDSSKTSSSIGNIINNVTANDNVELSQLIGTWNYSGPAVGLKSENLLKNLGGSVATSTIEDKLKVYYNKAGITNMVLTIDNNYNFTLKAKKTTFSGVIEKGENGIFIFNFKAFGKVKVGKVNTYTTLSGNTLSLTYDVKKLIELVQKISNLVNISSVKTAIAALNSYEGVTAGFKLTKQ